jgi:hypothetical protein
MLRRVGTLLFLFAYFGSSFVTNRYRSGRIAELVIRAVTSNHHLQINRIASDNYPRFREAKKAAFDFAFRSDAIVRLFVQGKPELIFLQLYWEIQRSLLIEADRAPPLQA